MSDENSRAEMLAMSQRIVQYEFEIRGLKLENARLQAQVELNSERRKLQLSTSVDLVQIAWDTTDKLRQVVVKDESSALAAAFQVLADLLVSIKETIETYRDAK